MIYCEKAEFGQISRSFSLNSGAIRLKRPKNLTQIGFLSLRSVKSDRLLAPTNHSWHCYPLGNALAVIKNEYGYVKNIFRHLTTDVGVEASVK